jgi:hypothetical protein
MKKYIPIYYLLCVLLVFGAFAAMAQNAYGLTILGLVAASFAIVFLTQLLYYFNSKDSPRDRLVILELSTLILMSGILSLRVFYLRFMFVEEIFIAAGFLLAVVFTIRLIKTFKHIASDNKIIAFVIALFHASIILYLLSMTMVPLHLNADPIGIAAFALFIAFIFAGWLSKSFLLDGKKESAFSLVTKFRDRSVLLIALFLIFTAYMGLTRINVVPKMYTDEYPQAYFKLLNEFDAEVDGSQYKHEEFKSEYDKFVERHAK